MRAKRKITLEEGESYVVYDYEMWSYLIATVRELGNRFETGSEDWKAWQEVADNLSEQVENTYNPYDEYEE